MEYAYDEAKKVRPADMALIVDKTSRHGSDLWIRERVMEAKSSTDLAELREQIDKADQMILSAFVTRMRVCRDVAEYKKANGIPVLDAAREQQKLDEIRKLSPNDMEDSCVLLYNKIMELSRELQQKIIDENH